MANTKDSCNSIDGKCLEYFMEHDCLHKISGILMIFYAIIMGLKTSPSVMQSYSGPLCFMERALCWIFALEIIVRLFASGMKFFQSGWNIFDLLVIGSAAIAESTGIASIRVLRLFRISEVLSASQSFRLIATSLVKALPGILHVAVLLFFMFYLSSIVAFDLFSKTHPDLFGSFSKSIYTLFLLMIGDGVGDVLSQVIAVHPHSYIFFVLFLTVMTFTMLNLFFGLIVDAIQSVATGRGDKDANFEKINNQLSQVSERLSTIETALKDKPKKAVKPPKEV